MNHISGFVRSQKNYYRECFPKQQCKTKIQMRKRKRNRKYQPTKKKPNQTTS